MAKKKKSSTQPKVIVQPDLSDQQIARAELAKTFSSIDKINEGLAHMAEASYDIAGISSKTSLVLTQDSNHVHIISECVNMYRTTGLVKNIIDLMSDFTAEGIDIVHDNIKQQKFYQAWASRINLPNRVEHIARTYFKEGNVAIYSTDGKITKKEENILITQGAISKKGEESFVGNDFIKRTIPIRYEIYNPLKLKKDGPIGNKIVFYKIDEKLVKMIKKDAARRTDIEKLMVNDLPKKFVKEIKASKGNRDVYVTLGLERDDQNLSMIYYKKDDWEDWADPVTFAALDDLKFKKLLRAADDSAARNVINSITLWKVGDCVNGFIPSPGELEKLADLLKNPSKSKNIVWPDLIEVDTAYAPVDMMFGQEKYVAVNSDILAAYGVSAVIANGGGGDGNYANSFLSVKTLMERLETCRSEILTWLTKELRRIMKAMGWKTMPHIRFGRMSLRDEVSEKEILMKLVDRNIISAETVLQYFGESSAVEIQRIKREKELYEKNNIKRNSPIESKEDLNTPDQNEDDFDSKGPGQEGRPKNDKTKQKKERDTKPQGMGTLNPLEVIELGSKAVNLYGEVERLITDKYCKNYKVKNKKSLLKEQRQELDKIIFTVFSNLSVYYDIESEEIIDLFDKVGDSEPDARASEIFESLKVKHIENLSLSKIRELRAHSLVLCELENYTEAPAKLDRCVAKIYKGLLEKEKKKGKVSDKKKKELKSSAFAICTKQLS